MSAIDNLTDVKLTDLLRMVRELTDEDFNHVIENLSKMEELVEERQEIDKDQLQLNLN
jgi:hypothetical protein